MQKSQVFPFRLQRSTKRKTQSTIGTINDVLLYQDFHSQISDTTRFFKSTVSTVSKQQPKQDYSFLNDDYTPLTNKDVYYHTNKRIHPKHTLSIPTHLSTQQSLRKSSTLPQNQKLKQTPKRINTAKPIIKLTSQPKSIEQKEKTYELTKEYEIQQPILNQYIYDEPKLQQMEMVKKKPLIDTQELKLLYDEIAHVDGKLDKMSGESDQFVKNLYKDKEKFLKVKDNVLTDYELQFMQEQLKLKSELIKNQQTFECMNFDQIDDIIRKLQFFERFTKSTRINLIKLGTYMEVPPGEYVFHQGDFGDNLFVILSGSVVVKIEKQFNKEGPIIEQVVSSLYDGQHFGELAMMETSQKGEEQVLEEKLENINIKSFEEVKKDLFRQDMEILEKQSRMLKNMKMKEMQRQNSSVVDWMKEEPQEKHYVMRLANNDDKEDPGTTHASNIEYKKVLKHTQRKASIQASETCHLLAISRDNFKNILMVLMQDELEQKIKMLKSLRFLNHIQPFVLIPLANQLIAQRFHLDEVLIKEGEPLDYMYILFKGSCNVIRTTMTQRIRIPDQYKQKNNRKSYEYLYSHQPKIKEETEDYLHKLQDNEGINYKIPDFAVESANNAIIQYRKSYVYKKIYPGDVLFGRVLTGLTLEGKKGEDTARMTVVSSSSNTIMYKISQKLLQFCPEFLIQHLVNQLIISKEIDQIPKSELNKEIKEIFSKQKKLTFDEQLMEQEQIQKKQQLEEFYLRNRLRKPQNEWKQDELNKQWEYFKQVVVIDQLQYNNAS